MNDDGTTQHEGQDSKVKEALKNDWEQTKSDLPGGKKGTDLHQDVPDTVKQATGKEPLPPEGAQTPKHK